MTTTPDAAPSADRAATVPSTMWALTHDRFGGPEVLSHQQVPVPHVADDRVLVQVRAASVNPYDWHMLRSKPYMARPTTGWRRPKHPVLGADLAGVVVAVGADVEGFAVGDEVFGEAAGSFAEYVAVRPANIVPKPASAGFAEAAATPMAGITALQGLRAGGIERGQRVLIHGASGGVGSAAVQIAKALGCHVTAVVGTRNLEMVRDIGADVAVDYTTTDITAGDQTFDLILDTVTTHSMRAYRRILTETGSYVSVGAVRMGNVIGPFVHMGRIALGSLGRSQTMRMLFAKVATDDLAFLAELLADGSLSPVIERTYPLAEGIEAVRYVEEGHTSGKVVILP